MVRVQRDILRARVDELVPHTLHAKLGTGQFCLFRDFGVAVTNDLVQFDPKIYAFLDQVVCILLCCPSLQEIFLLTAVRHCENVRGDVLFHLRLFSS